MEVALSTSQADFEDALETLRLCQLELAQVRSAQEPLMEALESTRAELMETQQRLAVLARTISGELLTLPRSSSIPERGLRWVRRRRLSRSEEWRQAVRIEQSDLFDGTWYLEHHPAAAASGLPPALHYLRLGAAQGFDPGPRFSTSGYLSAHQKVASSGVNPLLHYLRPKKGRQGGQQR
jgi:hypothetical protein